MDQDFEEEKVEQNQQEQKYKEHPPSKEIIQKSFNYTRIFTLIIWAVAILSTVSVLLIYF